MNAPVTISRRPSDPALDEALRQVAGLGRLSDGDVRAMRAARRRTLTAGVGALLVAITAGGLAGSGLLAPAPVRVAHLETQRGRRLTARLADGTVLRLDGATSLDVRLSAHARTVRIVRGAAFFDVAHRPAAPFRVVAGDAQAAVLGTAFTVDRGDGTGVALAVYRGRVRFGGAGGGGVEVRAGFRSQVERGVVALPVPLATGEAAGWIDTDAMRLRDLVATLNRRGGPPIAPPPPALADMGLAGRFRLDGSRALLEAIGAADGFTVREEAGALRLVPDPTRR